MVAIPSLLGISVVLFTVLAIAGMQAAAIELLMAGNELARQRAFEAAESGIEQALAATTFSVAPDAATAYDDPAAVEPLPIPGHGTPIDGCAGDPGRPAAHCEYFVRFDRAAGATLLPGMDPAAALRAYHFIVDSVGVAARTAAPAAIASSVACSKLNVCGPTTTGVPTAHASIRFCPPSGSRLPPISATSAAA